MSLLPIILLFNTLLKFFVSQMIGRNLKKKKLFSFGCFLFYNRINFKFNRRKWSYNYIELPCRHLPHVTRQQEALIIWFCCVCRLCEIVIIESLIMILFASLYKSLPLIARFRPAAQVSICLLFEFLLKLCHTNTQTKIKKHSP